MRSPVTCHLKGLIIYGRYSALYWKLLGEKRAPCVFEGQENPCDQPLGRKHLLRKERIEFPHNMTD
eukprot:1157303-Pelagomonas_calceolata.AAC.12